MNTWKGAINHRKYFLRYVSRHNNGTGWKFLGCNMFLKMRKTGFMGREQF